MQKKMVILVHGGAGKRKANRNGLLTIQESLERGFSILKEGGGSLLAVEEAIRVLEDDDAFNAGTGSRLQLDGVARMDASIMNGRSLEAGAVASIEGIKNPISAARLILEQSPHVLMAGERAKHFVLTKGVEEKEVITSSTRRALEEKLRRREEIIQIYNASFGGDTVGAVALDREKNLAAGSSTGGSTWMLPGRVGDTPQVGSGIYADNRVGAVSSTGLGESIIRVVLAREVCLRMEKGDSPLLASQGALELMTDRVGGTAGVITLQRDGSYSLVHNSPYMSGGILEEGKNTIVENQWIIG